MVVVVVNDKEPVLSVADRMGVDGTEGECSVTVASAAFFLRISCFSIFWNKCMVC